MAGPRRRGASSHAAKRAGAGALAALAALIGAGATAAVVLGGRGWGAARWTAWSTAPALLLVLLAWESVAPALPLFLRSPRGRIRHGARNGALTAMNGVMSAAAFAVAWSGTASWAAAHGFGLLARLGGPDWVRALAAIVLLDLWAYGWHRLNHHVPWLWRLHRTHHSDPRMDVTTAGRFHVGEMLLTDALRVPLIVLLGLSTWNLVAYEAAVIAVSQFHHANVALPPGLDRAFRVLIVTPGMHRVHHSRARPETDSNYAAVLSVWDRVFRSFRVHDDPRTIRFGLDGFDDDRHQTVTGLLRTPLGPSPHG